MNQRAEQIRDQVREMVREIRTFEKVLAAMSYDPKTDGVDQVWRARAAAKMEVARQVLEAAWIALDTAYELNSNFLIEDEPEGDVAESA